MVRTLAWIPFVRNFTRPSQTTDSSPSPAEGQSSSPGARKSEPAMEGDGGRQLELQAKPISAEGRRVALVAGLEALDKGLEAAREASALRHQ